MPSAKVNPVPEGQIIIPYLLTREAAKAIDFYRRAFGAEEQFRLDDGARIGHAELLIGRARFMLADEYPEQSCVGPATLGGTSVSMMVYVADVDAFAARAVAAGATLERPIKDEFYGARVAWLKDPFGHRWSFASRSEDVSPEEMKRRMSAH
jgi:PhnB protein